MSRTHLGPLAIASALVLSWMFAPIAPAQEDEALKRLMKKLEQVEEPKADDERQKKAGEVDERDADLDDLLKGIGQSADRPEAKGDAAPGAEGLERPDQLPDEAKDTLDREDQSFDEHLRRLLGRIDPDRDQDQDGQSQSSGGPLGETMKKMREVERRLSKLDTGEQTREQQREIIEELETLLRRIRQQQQQQQGQPREQQTEMAGQQQGQNQGDQPGDQPNPEGGGSPPQTPEQNPALVNAKDTWGHLQGALRDVMGNVSQMLPLPEKRELIERYFLSVGKRAVDR